MAAMLASGEYLHIWSIIYPLLDTGNLFFGRWVGNCVMEKRLATVTSGSFTGSVSPTNATISVGGSQNFTVQVNSSGSFQGQVNLACNAASALTCQLTPNQVALAIGGSATASLNISVTTKPAIAPLNWPEVLGTGHQRPRLILFLFVVLLAIWLCKTRQGPNSVARMKSAGSYQAVFLALALLAF